MDVEFCVVIAAVAGLEWRVPESQLTELSDIIRYTNYSVPVVTTNSLAMMETGRFSD